VYGPLKYNIIIMYSRYDIHNAGPCRIFSFLRARPEEKKIVDLFRSHDRKRGNGTRNNNITRAK